MKIKLITKAFLIVFASISYGVEPAESEKTEEPASAVKWYSESQLANPAIAEPNYVDTTLKGFQKYDFAYRKRHFFANKGIAGHATRNLVFSPLSNSHGFTYLKSDVFKGITFSHDNLRFYRPEYVFTDLYYLTGGEREQLFYAQHSQRLNENLVMSFKYQLMRCPSLYSRIKSYNANLYGTIDYISDNERYQALGSFVWNRIENQESGGLRNHKGFEEDEARDSVWLYNADGRFRQTEISIHQYYQLGFHRKKNNENNDYDDKFVNLGRIYHNSSYRRSSYIFEENDPPHDYFAGHPHVDSLQTYDSTIVHNITNKIGYSNYRLKEAEKGFPVFFNIYLKHSYYNIHHPFGHDKDKFSQFSPGIRINTDRRNLFSFKGFLNYTFGGYNSDDFSAGIGGSYDIPVNENRRINMQASYHEKEAPYLMNKYYSNYVSWDNNFPKTLISHGNLEYESHWLTVDLNIYHLENWQYFDNNALPSLADESFIVSSAGLKSNLKAGVFCFDNHIIYQHLSNDNYEQFPSIVSYHSVYADLVLFDKALYAHVGADMSYNSPYYAQSYMPAFKQFYSQNEYKTPDYIFLDVFLNLKISRARVFVKWQNLGSLLWGQQTIYTIPFYPHLESQVRFGVSWMFYD